MAEIDSVKQLQRELEKFRAGDNPTPSGPCERFVYNVKIYKNLRPDSKRDHCIFASVIFELIHHDKDTGRLFFRAMCPRCNQNSIECETTYSRAGGTLLPPKSGIFEFCDSCDQAIHDAHEMSIETEGNERKRLLQGQELKQPKETGDVDQRKRQKD